jgi:uncharacterized repeat protein (TIGR03803 family)
LQEAASWYKFLLIKGDAMIAKTSLNSAAAICVLAAAFAARSGAAHAAYGDVYNFCSQANCSDGASPVAGMIADAAGNLYGTTLFGGANNGTVFRIAPDGTHAVVYSFCALAGCADGSVPAAGLIRDKAGNLYGTTVGGGAKGHCRAESGCGTVYKIAPDGSETVLYSFCQQSKCGDGSSPYGGLLMDGAGSFYGTTSAGGSHSNANCDCGTVFKLTPAGAETVLYSFCAQANCADGSVPTTSLIADRAGNLYGTTAYGGDGQAAACLSRGCGAVFEISTAGIQFVLYSFCSNYTDGICADGNIPSALIADRFGNLYGTTEFGGISGPCTTSMGCGTVFALTPDGTQSTLYTFCQDAASTCLDSSTPTAPLLYNAKKQIFYGTTTNGGAIGGGTVFQLDGGSETVLYSFGARKDGKSAAPEGGVAGVNGVLYGTTSQGGKGNNSAGTVFKLATFGLGHPQPRTK